MFDIKPSQLPGCFELAPAIFDDSRGRFVKVFQTQEFARLGLETDFHEEYYSVSRKNVIRGLHFQVPPMDCLNCGIPLKFLGQLQMRFCLHVIKT